jgi:Na+-driven multidrug efflux pump
VGLAEIIGILFFLFAPMLIGLFSDDPSVIEYGVRQAKTEALFYCLLAFSHAVAAVCRGAGKAFVPMSIMLSVWCILRISYITLVMHFIHDIGMIYWAYPLTWGISSVIYFFYYFCSDWIHGFEHQKEKRAAKALKSSS